jgi:hypothetical protein
MMFLQSRIRTADGSAAANAAGITTEVCYHTFHGAGITTYLETSLPAVAGDHALGRHASAGLDEAERGYGLRI